MTGAEWFSCTDPQAMLGFLHLKSSDRKLRLFACACCRRMWHLMTDGRSRRAVEVAERFADGLAKQKERKTAEGAARSVCLATSSVPVNIVALNSASGAVWTLQKSLNYYEASDIANAVCYALGVATETAHLRAQPLHAALVRDLLGNPFCLPSVDPAWLTWNDRTVQRLAEAIYDERSLPDGHLDASRMGVLADALEDSGCDNAEILNHLRVPAVHVRGCWVVDLLTGRE